MVMQHELSRRSLLVGTAASAGTGALRTDSLGATGIGPDVELSTFSKPSRGRLPPTKRPVCTITNPKSCTLLVVPGCPKR